MRTHETQTTTPNQTNTSSDRPRTQLSQRSLQPQRSHRPKTTQPTQPKDTNDDYISENLRINNNNIVKHVIGKEGRTINYDSKTEMMTITGTRQRDIYKTIRDIKEIIESRTQEKEATRSTPRNPTYPPQPSQHEPQHKRPRHEESERYTYQQYTIPNQQQGILYQITTKTKINRLIKEGRTNSKNLWKSEKKLIKNIINEADVINDQGEEIKDPETAKEHIATYYENLYQARPGDPQYEHHTKTIIKKLEQLRNHEKQYLQTLHNG